MQERPVFSVIIPTYNRPAMLARALASVARQEFSHFEVIVSDDCSTLSLDEILSSFPQLRIKLVRGSTNTGASGARNRGIEHASGHYISFLDDDDEWLPQFLGATFDRLERSKTYAGYCWSNICNVRYQDKTAVAWESTGFKLPEQETHMSFTDALSIGVGYGVTVSKEMLLAVGGFDPSLKLVEDTDIFIKLLSKKCYPTLVPEANVRVHHHFGDRMTGTALHAIRIRECWQLLEKHAAFFAQFPLLDAQLRHQIRYLQEVSSVQGAGTEKQCG